MPDSRIIVFVLFGAALAISVFGIVHARRRRLPRSETWRAPDDRTVRITYAGNGSPVLWGARRSSPGIVAAYPAAIISLHQ
ncbi:MAG TPA: hypothetical protein VFY84_04980 [Jiangellales bacterium]|nr:hypothetical protein [Jiangellales bacterium]